MTNSTKAWIVECDVDRDPWRVTEKDSWTAKRRYWSMFNCGFNDLSINDQNELCNTTTATRCYYLDGKI